MNKPGTYHGERRIKGLSKLPFNHEYVVVVPKSKRGLSKEARKSLVRVGDRDVLVAGAYKRKTKAGLKLKSKLGDRSDVSVVQKKQGKVRKVRDNNPNATANRIAKESNSFKSRDYPGVLRNIAGAGDNSNTYVRSLLSKVGKSSALPKSRLNPGSKRKMDLSSLGNIFELGAWTRKEGKRESGGLNQKGVESYRRENPGSKLKTAVTRDPSKLKKGGKSAKRRASFCARMSGMKKRRTSAKTANDPNSRINKSLRAWNC